MAPFFMPKRWFGVQFLRVKDPITGHEFDVPETNKRLASGEYKLVKSDQYPPSPRVRPAKHFVASKGVTPKPSKAAEIEDGK